MFASVPFKRTEVNSPLLRSSLRNAFQPLPVDCRSVIAKAKRSFCALINEEKLIAPKRRVAESNFFLIHKVLIFKNWKIKLRSFPVMMKKILNCIITGDLFY